MQTYHETRLLKSSPFEYHRNPNWVPQEFQDYVLRPPNVERNKKDYVSRWYDSDNNCWKLQSATKWVETLSPKWTFWRFPDFKRGKNSVSSPIPSMQCCATAVNMAKLGSNQSEREKDNELLSFWGVWLISIGYVINFFTWPLSTNRRAGFLHGDKNTRIHRKAHTCVMVGRMRSSAQGFPPAKSREWDRRHMRRPPKYSPGSLHSCERISA